jgi:hypothetical protein
LGVDFGWLQIADQDDALKRGEEVDKIDKTIVVKQDDFSKVCTIIIPNN